MLTFRALARADFPLVGRWLAEPLVARWWAQDPSPEGVEAEYGATVDGTEPGEVHLIELDGRPVGLIQRYRIGDFPEHLEELAEVGVPDGALSMDYLLGEPSARGRGLGPRAITAYVEQAWAAHPDATCVLVPVHAENRASWRALERAGFTRTGEADLEPDNPADSRHHVVCVVQRPH